MDAVLRLASVPIQAFYLEIMLDLEGLTELESRSSFCFPSKLPMHLGCVHILFGLVS